MKNVRGPAADKVAHDKGVGRVQLGSRTADGQARVDTLLTAAARLFWDKGYEATSTRDLAAAIGVQKASLYYYIDTKEDLLFLLSRDALEHLQTAVEAAAGSTEDVVERLRLIVYTHVVAMLEEREKHATMLTELRSLSPDRTQAIILLRDRYEHFVCSGFIAAQRAGQVRHDVSAKMLTLALLDMLNWAIFWYAPEGEMEPSQIGEAFAAIFLGGALVRPDSPG